MVVNNGITKEQRHTHQSIYTQLYIVPNICRNASVEISPKNALDRVPTACLCESVSQYYTETRVVLVQYLRKCSGIAHGKRYIQHPSQSPR